MNATDLSHRTVEVIRKYQNTEESRELLADIRSFLSCGRPVYRATPDEEERMTQ